MTALALKSTTPLAAFRSLVTLFALTLAAIFAIGGAGEARAQSQLVTIQGGGLQFLDATAPDKYNLGLTAVITSYTGAQSQQWLIADAGNGFSTIQQRSSGLYLDAHEVPSEAFFVVLRPRQTFDSTQLWRIINYGGGFVTIQQASSGRYLEATSNPAVNYQVVTGATMRQSTEWRLGSP